MFSLPGFRIRYKDMKKRYKPRTVAGRFVRNRMNVIVPLLAIAFLAVLIRFSIRSHVIFRDALVDSFQSRQLTIVEGTAQGIESLFTRLTSEMLTLASSHYVKDPLAEDGKNHIREFYKANQDIVYAGYRMDRKGVLVYMYPLDENAINKDISGQAHIVKLFATKRLVVSGFFQAVEGFEAIAVHAPVFKDMRFNGSVATIVKLDKISGQFLKNTKAGNNGYSWLVDEDGVILYHPNSAYIGLEITETDLFDRETRENIRKIIRRQEAAKVHLGDTLFAMAPFEIGNRVWTVILSTPYSDISGPIVAHFRNTWIFNGGVIIVLLFAGAFYMRAAMRASVLELERDFFKQKVGLEEELRQSRDRLDTIVRTIPSGLFTVDSDRIIRSWNDTAERITGFSAAETIGKRCTEFFHDPCGRKCGLYEPAGSPKPIVGTECAFRTKNRGEITISKNCDFLRDPDSGISGGIESFIDITEAKRAEEERIKAAAYEKEIEQLRKMDEVKTNFLSMVSHELRTPLSVMLGNLGMADKGKYGDLPPGFAEKLKIILKRGWQLNDLIDNLLDLSRIKSGRAELNKQQIDLPETVSKLIREFQENAEEKKLLISTDFEPGARFIEADRVLFSQLLRNLISNAVKFTPEGGGILVSSYLKKDLPVVSVKDNGIGIPDEEQKKVFGRFYQIDNSSTRQYGGTGLGLAIVKDIVDLHNAAVEIESRSGEGTEIRVVFPAGRILFGHGQSEREREAASVTSLPHHLASKPCAILVVDNDTEFLTALTDFAEGSQTRMLCANTIREAVEVLDGERVDLLVLDPTPFEQSETLDLIGRLAEKKDTDRGRPFVVLVSEDRESVEKLCSGRPWIAACLEKPFKPEPFIEILQFLLS